jgi:Icc protein
MVRSVECDPWRIVLLDSQVPGMAYGRLAQDELNTLEDVLRESNGHPALVCLHHGSLPACPVPGCRLENAGEFLELLGRYPNVRGVLSGHVHCVADELQGGIRMLVGPSTCVHAEHPDSSFVPDGRPFLETHRLDTGRRGFRQVELYPDGEIVSRVVWECEEVYS